MNVGCKREKESIPIQLNLSSILTEKLKNEKFNNRQSSPQGFPMNGFQLTFLRGLK